MWPEGFDPQNLTPDASLNKLVVGAVPGAQPAHVGRNGGDLLSRDAIVDVVHRRCGAPVDRAFVADRLVAALATGDARAVAVLDEVGDRLASVLATLWHPSTAAAATGGRRTYLEVWRCLDLVVLGGGLMKGAVGEAVVARVGALLRPGGDPFPTVRVSRHPEWLPLLGAARSASGGHGQVLVVDCGQTSIKQGVAMLREGRLARLRTFEPLPVGHLPRSEVPRALGGVVGKLVAAHSPGEVVLSVASYVAQGRPVDHSSVYGPLDPTTIRSRVGVPVRLLHDGTAAWRGAGTRRRSAVITLGTWLGVGIGPHRDQLRPYSDDFTVDPEPEPPGGDREPAR